MWRDQGKAGRPWYARSAFLVAASGILLFLVGVSTIKETYQGWKVEQEIQGLQMQVATLEGKKLHLTDTLQRLQAPDTLDKEARLRLGVQKPGERVFVIPAAEAAVANNVGEGDGSSGSAADISNPYKWFQYFFIHH